MRIQNDLQPSVALRPPGVLLVPSNDYPNALAFGIVYRKIVRQLFRIGRAPWQFFVHFSDTWLTLDSFAPQLRRSVSASK